MEEYTHVLIHVITETQWFIRFVGNNAYWRSKNSDETGVFPLFGTVEQYKLKVEPQGFKLTKLNTVKFRGN